MKGKSVKELTQRIEELEARLVESDQLIEAIKAGEVDAFTVSIDGKPEVYTLQSGDYAYRLLIEEFGEGAVNITEDGLIVYTNLYFTELLGLPYEDIAGSLFTDYIYPGHLGLFYELFARAKKDRSKGEISLLVKDRVIPVYISLTSLRPSLNTVGIIISDLTHRKKQDEVISSYQKNLETKNLELTQSNSELASFTYIASHDLQEPLRKIQTFSNLIMSKDQDKLSAETRDYFDRISSAATRMQNLLMALLNYSRTNNSDSLFVATDLSQLVEEAKDDLAEMLDERHATIHVSPLPTLKVIPNQFVQFFTNIISNAIKYSRDGVNPVITISADMVTFAEMGIIAAEHSDHYWLIRIADNGIGFEQQYSEKIFELFQRLYTREKYEGTGVGLAICKKIIQNHNGFITASGRPGIGSVFSIYLPINKEK